MLTRVKQYYNITLVPKKLSYGGLMKVFIKCRTQQVIDGLEYKEQVRINGIEFDCELKLAGPIWLFSTRGQTEDIKELRTLYRLSVTRDKVKIDLNDKEFKFFCSILLPFAAECYVQILRNRVNKMFPGSIIDLKVEYSSHDSVVIVRAANDSTSGIESAAIIGTFDIPWEICRMLDNPKFGCMLTS